MIDPKLGFYSSSHASQFTEGDTMKLLRKSLASVEKKQAEAMAALKKGISDVQENALKSQISYFRQEVKEIKEEM